MQNRTCFLLAPLCFCLGLTLAPAFSLASPCSDAAAQELLDETSTALRTALAMHGAPKYKNGFTHFSYANPSAPKGGMLRLGVTGSFDSLNPFIIQGNPAYGLNLGAMSLVYEPLMARGWDEPFTLYGLIAETVEIAADRSAITFNLNPAAHFQDATPITADDVLFSYETLRDQGRPNHRLYYKKVARAEKLGDRRVRFVFHPNPDGSIDRELPLIMGLMPVLPKHDWQDRTFNQTTLRPPVGSGPYKIQSVDVGRRITYARDPAYWGKNLPSQRGLYNFDTVRVDYFRDDAIALQAFKAGQYDLRRETDPNKWATAYDSPALSENRIHMDRFPHHRTEPVDGFILNTRRPLFQDIVLRRAVQSAFDFGWINHTLFHDLYRPTQSFFPNAELDAMSTYAPPTGAQKEILKNYKDKLDPHVFSAPVSLALTDGTQESLRDHLLSAATTLKENGYTIRNEQLYTAQGAPVSFEILLSDPAQEKIALQWARALKLLGINAHPRTVDSAQYQARLVSFDYDVISGKWINSLSPGNEQSFFWGSAAAKQNGSRNYAGIQDPVVDALSSAIPATITREDLVATTRALDRVLMFGAYIVPFYHLGADYIASWNTLHHTDITPLYGSIIESWWAE